MKHVGDITKLSGYSLPIPDVVTGGSPCQDLSIAGNRAGLSGERSVMFMEQIRVIKELRDADAKRTDEPIRPRYMVWENVPGALSSHKGEDFRIILEETAKIADTDAVIPEPPKGKWRNAGVIMGDGWSIAWRILDAQFWGVPQRRRRIALVADFGGFTAPEILFVRKGVCGDFEAGGTAGKGAAGTAARNVAIPINTQIATRYKQLGGGTGLGIGDPGDPAYTLQEAHSHAVLTTGCLTPWESQRRRIHDTEAPLPTLDGSDGGDGRNPGGLFLTQSANTASESEEAEQYTVDFGRTGDRIQMNAAVAPTLQAEGGGGGGGSENICVMSHGQSNAEITENISPTLNCNHEQPIVAGVDCRNGTESPELCATLQAHGGGGASLNATRPIRINYQVRRLTPLECERLQGYPDGWTAIPDYIDAKGKKKTASDTVRYKALGNSIALPPWKWVLKRISAHYERDATLGSLFDGIGGFPYIWEQINGKGTALWASEIEPFCIAVTERRLNQA